jgi:inosine-uridine nucleoside N-ribohydrolase
MNLSPRFGFTDRGEPHHSFLDVHAVCELFNDATYLKQGATTVMLLLLFGLYWCVSFGRDQSPPLGEKVIIDTDIGGDIDDAFAVALALESPELTVLGFSTTYGDTRTRAKILDRMLNETGHSDIPVSVGVEFPSDRFSIGPQARYGEVRHYDHILHTAAVDFILHEIKTFPGEVTLVAIGPLSNIGALIDKDIATFKRLKRVVMMGGWINPLEVTGVGTQQPAPENNIVLDVDSAKKLFQSGVPIYMIPYDSTENLALDELNRRALFYKATPLTDSLGLQYLLWSNSGYTTPVLYDAMAVAFTINPLLCPVEPLRILVDDKGMTLSESGPSNAQVCLHSNPKEFIDYYMSRVGKGVLQARSSP